MPAPRDRLYAAAIRDAGLPDLFNPFRDRDATCDTRSAARIRRDNLRHYFAALDALTAEGPRDLWLAEAPGATGTRRTGIPLVDERELALANAAYPLSHPLQRATKGALPAGTTTGQAIWAEITRSGYLPVLWNVLLHHPERRIAGRLTNRPPRTGDVRHFTPLVRDAYTRWCRAAPEHPAPRVIAIGKFAERAARDLELPNVHYVRHPAQGGLTAFREGMRLLYPPAS